MRIKLERVMREAAKLDPPPKIIARPDGGYTLQLTARSTRLFETLTLPSDTVLEGYKP